MKNLKILGVLALFIGVLYVGVEPLSRHVMHPTRDAPDYRYSDLPDGDRLRALIAAGAVDKGRELVTTHCLACHTVRSQGLALMDDAMLIKAHGLLPPDLSTVATVVDDLFLYHFLANPAKASYGTLYHHRVGDLGGGVDAEGKPVVPDRVLQEINAFHASRSAAFVKMPPYEWLGEESLAAMVAYMKSVAVPFETLSGRDIAVATCSRCHAIGYDDLPLQARSKALIPYLGQVPPDLSLSIRARGYDYVDRYVNDPQKMLAGTSMPRVGLTEAAQQRLMRYIENVGDPRKAEREALGVWVVLFFAFFTLLAWFWRRYEFSRLQD